MTVLSIEEFWDEIALHDTYGGADLAFVDLIRNDEPGKTARPGELWSGVLRVLRNRGLFAARQ